MATFYPQWLHVSRVSVANPPSSPGYPVSVTVTWQPGMNDDFSDIRFSDYARTLPYWIETYTSRTSATGWVKLTETDTSAKEFFLYYGNGGATSESSGKNVFSFFDDFTAASIDTSIWGTTGTPALSSSVVTLLRESGTDDVILSTSTVLTTNKAIRARVKSYHNSTYVESVIWHNGNWNYYGAAWYCNSLSTRNVKYMIRNGGDAQETTAAITGVTNETWFVQDIIRNGSTSIIHRVDGANEVTISTNVWTGDAKIGVNASTANGSKIECDWILVRLYQSTEPTCTIAETGINPPSLSFMTRLTNIVLSAVQHLSHIDLTWSE